MRLFPLLALALLLVPADVSAQTLPAWGEPTLPEPTPMDLPGDELDGPTLPGAPTPVPVDGGLGLLGLAGAAYAWRRLKKNDSKLDK